MPQRMQRRRGSRPIVDPLEHAVHGVIGKRPDRAAQRPPQRLPPPLRDKVSHLHLVEPQPHERVRGGRQLLQLTGSLADYRDHLPPRVHPRHRGRQQLRGPRPGGHVKGDQGPVTVRRQPGENLVELPVGDTARDPGGHPRPVEPAALAAEWLHRIVVRVRPPATPRPVQRERVDDRPGARIAVKVVKRPQHRLRMRTDRRRIRFSRTSRSGRPRRKRRAPMRPGLLASDQQPPAEIPGLDTCRPIPGDSGTGPKKPEPAQKVQPIGPDC